MIAALYIDPRGPYARRPGVDAYDAMRNANHYDERGPVVAHPPCGPWSTMRHLYRGSEQDCGPRAVLLVRRHGGILEQPARSMLWDVQGLLKPRDQGGGLRYSERDRWGGYSIEVDQVEWGHVARKRTWLYIVGVPWLTVARAWDARPYPGRKPTHYVSGSRHDTARQGSPVPPGIKVCSATQRSRTPELFAAWLVALAGQVSL